ncbi:MAG TPA: DnaJ C-terminal domain-containing protein [Dermatophilaceae bacterium]|nr:DnaJ C-terminal domain-containing protein [Dermatophilaceae bacterium]
MASQDWFEKDFYAILGVPADADDAQIKKTYRKLARQWHPDSKPGNTAAERKFKEIGEAYAVLSDPEQRRQYDAIRSMSRGGARFTAGGPGGGTAGFEDVFSNLFGGGGGNVRFSTGGGGQANFEDILSMFGQGGAYAPGAGAGYGPGFGSPGRGADLQAQTSLSFRDAVEGTTATFSVQGRPVTTRIPAGVKDGQRIRLRGKGAPGPGGDGDLILTVHVEPHPVFGREGNDLTIELPVTFAEAALGATVPVPTLDGATVKVRLAPGTPGGRVLRVKGRGVRGKNAPGDLLVKVNIVVPQRLSDAARAAVETLRAEEDGADPRADLFAKARS